MGKGYTKEEIIQRINNKKLEPDLLYRYKTYGNRTEIRNIIFIKTQRSPGWKMNSMQKQFFRRWNNTYFIRKPDRYRQVWKYREDILEVQNLANALNYLITYDIGSEEMLLDRQRKVEEEKEALELQLRVLQTKKRKKSADIEGVQEEIQQIRKLISDSKQELRLIIKTQELFYQNIEREYENPEQSKDEWNIQHETDIEKRKVRG